MARGAEVLFSSDVDTATLIDVQRLVDKTSLRGNSKVNLMESSNNNNNNNNSNGDTSCSILASVGSNVYLAVPTNLEGKQLLTSY